VQAGEPTHAQGKHEREEADDGGLQIATVILKVGIVG
jgi:hypothetical protein